MKALYDLVNEALAAILARPARAFLISAGTLAGVAALVATFGLAATARAQIGGRFNALTATEVTVAAASAANQSLAVPNNASVLADRINGVVQAGRYWQVNTNDLPWRNAWAQPQTVPANLYAADPNALAVIGPHIIQGRLFTRWDEKESIPAVLLSASLAAQLSIKSIIPPSYVFLGQRAYLVIGIYNDVQRQPETLLAAVITTKTSDAYYGSAARISPTILVATRAGSAQVVASQLPLAERPEDPGALVATAPESSDQLRGAVNADVTRLLLLLSLVALTVGALSITNGTLVSVLERVPEIGLRRALGAQRRHIAGQFMIEGALTGTVGGLLGFATGVFVVVVLSAANGWTPTMDLPVAALAPLAGTATGLFAAVYPAWRATLIPAAQALQR